MRTPLLLLVALFLATSGCTSQTHIRSAIGTVAPLSVNLAGWKYMRTSRSVSQRWGNIGPPLWIRPGTEGGWEAIGVLIEPGSVNYLSDYGLYFERPGRTLLVGVSLGPDGRLRRPTEQVRRDMASMIPVLRRQTW